MNRIALLSLLIVTGPLYADPPVVPPPIKCSVNEDIQVTIRVAPGTKGAYAPGFDTADCLLFRGYSDDETRMEFLVRPKRALTFRVVFWQVGEGAYSTLVIDASGVVPPGPTPPVPPPGPAPDPALLALLQAAYRQEGVIDPGQRVTLARVMRDAARWADDPAYPTNAALIERVTKERKAAIGEALLTTRGAIGKYLDGLLGTDEVMLTADLRKKYAAAYTQVALAVEALR